MKKLALSILFILIVIFHLNLLLGHKLSKLSLNDLDKQEKLAILTWKNDGYPFVKKSKILTELAESESNRLALLGRLELPSFKLNISTFGYSSK